MRTEMATSEATRYIIHVHCGMHATGGRVPVSTAHHVCPPIVGARTAGNAPRPQRSASPPPPPISRTSPHPIGARFPRVPAKFSAARAPRLASSAPLAPVKVTFRNGSPATRLGPARVQRDILLGPSLRVHGPRHRSHAPARRLICQRDANIKSCRRRQGSKNENTRERDSTWHP